jgi:hypothetical protein
MTKVQSYDDAREMAEQEHLAFALCVFEPSYFVGRAEEIAKFGVLLHDYSGGE